MKLSQLKWVLLCASLLFSLGCRPRHSMIKPSDPENATGEKNSNPIRKMAAKIIAPPAEFLIIYAAEADQEPMIMVDDDICDDDPMQSGPLLAKVPLVSAFGVDEITLRASKPPSVDVVADVGGTRILLSDGVAGFRGSLHSVCQTHSTEKDKRLVGNADMKTQIESWLTSIAPECHFTEIKSEGWYCELPTGAVSLAADELKIIQKTMIERWNRQPYLFTRRLAIASNLANVLGAADPSAGLDRLCKIISFSLPQELPMVFNSRRWQGELCNENTPNRMAVAVFGLFKAQQELEFLKLLFERTSSLGTLIVSLPRPPGNEDISNLWVSLRPAQEVTDRLAEESARIWNTEEGGDKNQASIKPNVCWHPVFSDSSDLMQLAQYVGIAGNTEKAICMAFPANLTSDRPISPPRYLAESIASETEFVLTNGHSKVLRLPQGTYTYNIAPAVTLGDSAAGNSMETMAHGEPSTGGTIMWSKKSARTTISSW